MSDPAGKSVVSREALARWYGDNSKFDGVLVPRKLSFTVYGFADALLASGVFESRESVQAEAPKLDPLPWKITNRATGAHVTTLPTNHPASHEVATFKPDSQYSQNPVDYGLEPAHD
jgi:hypothetical protein